MSRRSKVLGLSLLLLLTSVAGWEAVKRSRREAWVAELQRLGLKVTTEPAYDGSAESFLGFCRAIWEGERTAITIGDDDDARRFLQAAVRSTGPLRIITFINLSAEMFGGIEARYPMADLHAVLPSRLFEDDRFRNMRIEWKTETAS